MRIAAGGSIHQPNAPMPRSGFVLGPDAAVTSFPFVGNGRSMTLGRDDCFVRIVHDPASGLLLGIQAVGAGVSKLAGEFALALEMAAMLTDIAATIHAHPTLGETVQEPALMGLGWAFHG